MAGMRATAIAASQNTTESERGDEISSSDPNPARSSKDLREFVTRVQQRASLDTEPEAELLVRATVNQLGAQISKGQAKTLSATLPPELGSELLAQSTAQAKRFERQTFLDNISGNIHSGDLEQVEVQVRVVLTTLQSWSPSDELTDTIEQLPRGLADLFH